ncbi:MAG: MBL fold metallo-hydrolase [Candidatus Edwardsbacteria bacterium]|nr:MBL fold metallo-hydrolase [Candidatus Edwardsbacteria bacterium]
MTRLLIESGAGIGGRDSASGLTLLHYAAIKGYRDIAELLAAKGADLKVKDARGRTALDCAVQYGQDSCAALLRAKGAAGGRKQPAAITAPKDGDAVVWYLGHSGWAVRTSGHLLVFDYFKGERMPDDPGLIGGAIAPAELKGLRTIVFVSHSHGDHYMPAIFDWRNDVPDLTYVTGFAPRDKEGFIQLANRETREVAGAEITAIESNDSGQGFLVNLDGVTILHPGDHANRNRDLSGNYTPEIDFLASKAGRVDLMFVPVTGCNFGDQVAVRTGAYYAIRKLRPGAVLPMHAGDGGQQYREFASLARDSGITAPIAVAQFPGDHWELRNGKAGGSGDLAR